MSDIEERMVAIEELIAAIPLENNGNHDQFRALREAYLKVRSLHDDLIVDEALWESYRHRLREASQAILSGIDV